MSAATSAAAKTIKACLRALDDTGLVFVQDPAWPSIASLVAGGPIKGSWWAHPKGTAIFNTLGALDERDDVLFVKLLSKKVTLVHARHFPAVVALARARQKWQLTKLAPAAKKLLAQVDARGDDATEGVRATGAQAKALEERLLVHSRQVHTENGKHAIELTTWSAFARARSVTPLAAPSAGFWEIEGIVTRGNAAFGTKHTVPWPTSIGRAR
jgi:hypothetical protein